MNYIDFEVNNKVYKLRLNTRNIVALEKALGCNPIAVFGLDVNNPTIPTVSAMVAILHASLQQYNHGITLNDAFDMFDDYVADGHTPTDFIETIMELYKASGLIPKDEQEEKEIKEKNE